MPPASRHMKNVAVINDCIKNRRLGWLRRNLDVISQRIWTRGPIHFPMLSSMDLEHEKVGHIPVQIEAVLLAPSCIKVGGNESLKSVLQFFSELIYIRHNILHLVHNQGCALREIGNEFRRR